MYKNWNQISSVKDKNFRMAIALLDLNSDFGKMIIERLPEFFSENPKLGPVPFSVMVHAAIEYSAKNDSSHTEESSRKNLVTYCGIPPCIPVLFFVIGDDIGRFDNALLIPQELESAEETGKVYKWGKKELVLVEYTDSGEWYFVPAECVYFD